MFPFDNNTSENPSPDSLLKTSSSHFLQNPNPPFFSTFPSQFFDDHELPLHQPLVADPIPETSPKTGKRKRKAGKKDRHSKICTAHGIRDRRMRLSLQVARKFFDIQDMLGYDKASATIEWLLTNSKPAIRELVESKRKNSDDHFAFESDSFSFSSECEVVSGVAHEVTSSEKNEKKKSLKLKTHRSRTNDSVRESREKARARARRRTREKMMMKRHNSGSSFGLANCISTLLSDRCLDDQKLGFSIDQELLGNYHTSSLLLSPDRDSGTIEKLLGNSSGSNHSPISDNMMGFIGDWEMLSNATNKLVSSSMPMAGNSNENSVDTTHNFPFFAQ